MQNSDEKKSNGPQSPQLKSSILSYLTFWWTKDLFKIGATRTLEESDIYAPLQEHESKTLSNQYSKLWDEELDRPKPSILRLFMRACGIRALILGQIYSNVDIALK